MAALASARRSLILMAVALLVAALVSWPRPALAGGPTSVLLVAPMHRSTAALYTGDPRYAQLESLVTRGQGEQVAGPPLDRGYINVTWLIHDVSVWRTDRIALNAPGGPVISSMEMLGEGQQAVGPGPRQGEVWRRVSRPKELITLLEALKLLEPGKPLPAVPAQAEPPAAQPAARTTAAETGVMTGSWWALPGLLAGLLTALAWTHLRRRTQAAPAPASAPAEPSEPNETSQELLDRAY